MMLVINGGLPFNVWLFMAYVLKIFDTSTPAMGDKKFGQIMKSPRLVKKEIKQNQGVYTYAGA